MSGVDPIKVVLEVILEDTSVAGVAGGNGGQDIVVDAGPKDELARATFCSLYTLVGSVEFPQGIASAGRRDDDSGAFEDQTVFGPEVVANFPIWFDAGVQVIRVCRETGEDGFVKGRVFWIEQSSGAQIFEGAIIQVGLVLGICEIGHLTYEVCGGLVGGTLIVLEVVRRGVGDWGAGQSVRDMVRFAFFPDSGESVWEEMFLHTLQVWVFDGIEGVFVEYADKGLMVDDEFEG